MIFRIVAGVVAGASGAALVLTFPGLSPNVEANAAVATIVAAATVKADRLPERPVGTACSQKAWPYFEADCLRGTPTATATRSVRVIGPELAGRR